MSRVRRACQALIQLVCAGFAAVAADRCSGGGGRVRCAGRVCGAARGGLCRSAGHPKPRQSAQLDLYRRRPRLPGAGRRGCEPSFFGCTEPGACGTFLALTEGEAVTEGTHTFGRLTAGRYHPAEADFEAVGPQTLAGSGTAANPYVITTEAGAVEHEAESEIRRGEGDGDRRYVAGQRQLQDHDHRPQ